MDPSWLRRYVANFALLLVSVTLSVLVAEGLLRAYERVKLTIGSYKKGDVISLSELNYNETSVSTIKPKNEFRVLSFGDSFGYSIMKPEHSYCGIAAKRVAAALGNVDVRVVNLGEPASTFRDYIRAYSYWGELIEHDAAIFNIYMGNDILDIAYGYVPSEWKPARGFSDLMVSQSDGAVLRSRIPQKYPLRLMDHAYALYLTKKHREWGERRKARLEDERFNLASLDNLDEKMFMETNKTQLDNSDPSKLDNLAPGYAELRVFMGKISELRKKNVKVLIFLSPNEPHADERYRKRLAERFNLDMSHYDFTLTGRIIKEIARFVDPEIKVIDMSPCFIRESRGGKNLYYKTNTHWGPEGNALAGDIMGNTMLGEWFKIGSGSGKNGADTCDYELYLKDNAFVDDGVIKEFVRAKLAK